MQYTDRIKSIVEFLGPRLSLEELTKMWNLQVRAGGGSKSRIKTRIQSNYTFLNFFICPFPLLLPVLGPLEWYMTPTLDAALLSSSRAGADLGRTSDVSNYTLGRFFIEIILVSISFKTTIII